MKGYLQAGSIVAGIAALLGFMGMVSGITFLGVGMLLLMCSAGIVIVGLILTKGRLE